MACNESNSKNGASNKIDDLSYSPEEFEADQMGETGRVNGLMLRQMDRIPGPQKDCPGCIAQRCHTVVEEMLFHPYAKHGFDDGSWSHPNLERWHAERMKEKAAAAAAKSGPN